MTKYCHIDLLPERITLSFEDVETATLSVFFALAIVNPFGPTFQFVAAVGDPARQIGARLPIVHVMLNPFQQFAEQVGVFTIGEQWSPEQDLDPLIRLGFGSAPTLLLLGHSVPEAARLPLAAKILSSFGDEVIELCERVRAHFGDPWTRIDVDIRKHLDSPPGQRTTSLEDTGVQQASAQLAHLILRNEHIWPELRALHYAWRGSYEQTGISQSMKDAAFLEPRFRDFLFGRIFSCVWVPDAPEESTPPSLDLQDVHIVIVFGPTTAFMERDLRNQHWPDEIDAEYYPERLVHFASILKNHFAATILGTPVSSIILHQIEGHDCPAIKLVWTSVEARSDLFAEGSEHRSAVESIAASAALILGSKWTKWFSSITNLP